MRSGAGSSGPCTRTAGTWPSTAGAVLTHASLAALVVDPLADHLEQLITRALDNDAAR